MNRVRYLGSLIGGLLTLGLGENAVIALVPTANTGTSLLTITNAALAASRTYILPDAGADASFVLTAGNQTIAGIKSFTGTLAAGASGSVGLVEIYPATASKGKVTLTTADNSGNTTTAITVAAQAAARTYTVPDAGGNASFVMTAGAQSLGGVKTFSDGLAVADTKAITFGTSALTRSGNNVVATLPTTDPVVAGALWIDGTAIKVSAGA